MGRVTDDYGIKRAWFDYRIDELEPAERPIVETPPQTTEWVLDGKAQDVTLEVELMGLAVGQKLLVCVKAADHHDLGENENIGTSDRRLLDVVTPDELRAMLVRRELVLRKRFERIIQEVTETRDLLLRMEFGGADADEEAEDATDLDDFTSSRQQLTLPAQQALQMSQKNAVETRGVADAFDDVRMQFENNKIDTEELVDRLKQRIADPLHRIADTMFPELQLDLQRLEAKLDDRAAGVRQRDVARQRADDVLLEMEKVLQQMVELESFNEALELLRTIIELQQQLGEETRQRQKETIRGLLED